MSPSTTPKKRNPQDTTLRNTRAANAKIADLAARVAVIERWITQQPKPTSEVPEGSDQ